MGLEGTHSPDNLIAGDFPIDTDAVTILSGENLARGAVLGKITASGKYRECDTAAVDGSEDPKVILARATDASGGDVDDVPIYNTGQFNDNKITLKGATTVADVKEALRDRCIFLKTPVKA